MLLRGGAPQGRRFQQCPSYYFAAYHYEPRRKLGGITSKANNLSYDGVDQSNDVTAGILSQMVQFAEESVLKRQTMIVMVVKLMSCQSRRQASEN